MIGLDPESLSAAADTFDRAAIRLGSLGRALRMDLGTLPDRWIGPDARSDLATWAAMVDGLHQASVGVGRVAFGLRSQVAEQYRTSARGVGVDVDVGAAGPVTNVPGWVAVRERTLSLDLRASGEVLAGGGSLQFTLSELADGTASVSLQSTPELVAQLGYGNAGYLAAGGILPTELAFTFPDVAAAHAFLDGLPNGLLPERDDLGRTIEDSIRALPAMLGGAVAPAAAGIGVAYLARDIDEEAKQHGGKLSTSELGAGVRLDAGIDPVQGPAGAEAQVTIDEVIAFDAVSGGLVHRFTVDAAAGIDLFGAPLGVEGDVSVTIPMNRPDNGSAVATASLTVGGSAGVALLSKLGFTSNAASDLIETSENARITVTGRVATDPVPAMDALSLSQLAVDMARDGELVVTIETGNERSLSYDSAILDVAAADATSETRMVLTRSAGGAWGMAVDPSATG